MTKIKEYLNRIPMHLFLIACICSIGVNAQTGNDKTVTGIVSESGTRKALKFVSVSVASTGTSVSTDENGTFTIQVPDNQAELIFNMPGYAKRNIFLHGKSTLNVYLVHESYKSSSNVVRTPLGEEQIKNISYASTGLSANDLTQTSVSSFDQILQGKVAGLNVTNMSGMPGQRTYMNIRGISSLYADNEPVIFIDGMIHDYTNAGKSIIEGFGLNQLDIVDVDDIMDIAVLKDGTSFLGSAASNGIININTEQESETSTRIKFSAYGGIALSPKQQDVLSPNQFKSYFQDMLVGQGFSSEQINTSLPWLNGGTSAEGYYMYNNTTNWQEQVMSAGALQKYHFFLKGGDDIATYNISTGYINQKGILDNSNYDRFNLRINGKINITKKLMIRPNVKLSLGNSKVHNMGYTSFKNPLTSALLKPGIMTPYARDAKTGTVLPYLENVGVFNVSNPSAVVSNAVGANVNYNFLSSMNAEYQFTKNLKVSTLIGIDYSNAHEDIFLPDAGLAQMDPLVKNSPGYYVNEFQSLQNHSMLTYNNKTSNGHSYAVNAGIRYLKNNYKHNYAIDVNTASDEISSLGQGGGEFTYLREVDGDERGLKWISYFSNLKYNFRNKYFLEADISYDGTSAINEDNRFNFYPSIVGAWQAIPELKVRASWSQTGNMFSSIYDYSNIYYVAKRLNNTGVVLRETIANPDMEIEKKSTTNVGLDLTLFEQQLNLHVDAYQSNINNLLMHQMLKNEFGYTNYIDNGGQLQNTGLELGINTRLHLGPMVWTVYATAATNASEIKSMTFINANTNNVITEFEGGAMITENGSAPNLFYGYKTNGIFQNDADAASVIGPNGLAMQAGDVRYVDNGNNMIGEEDKVVIGDPNPDFFGGLFTSFTFDKFQLSAQLNYTIGNDAFNYVKYQIESMSSFHNQSVNVLDRWSGSGNELPKASFGDPRGNTVFSDRWIEDASYIRLKHITISYELPKFFGFRGWTVYASATNLLTLTNYSGFDPEFMYDNNPFYSGVDYGQMTQSRRFIMGVKLDL